MSIVIKDLNIKADSAQSYTYRDIDIFQTGGAKGNLAVTDVNSVRAAIHNLFLVKRGSRILDPTFGSNLDVYLFEPINDNNARLLADDVEEILEQEKRILVDDIHVTSDMINSQYIVDIRFYIPSLSKEVLDMSFVVNGDNGVQMQSTPINN